MTGGLVPVSTDIPEFEEIVDAFIARDFTTVGNFAEALVNRAGPVQALQLALIGLCRTGAFGKAHWFAQLAIDRIQGEDAWSADLISLAVGKVNLQSVLSDTLNEVEQCQAHYYAAAALISNRKYDAARDCLEHCVTIGAPCLELHLATVETQALPSRTDDC